jgi:heat-inducible transcriptional repressor
MTPLIKPSVWQRRFPSVDHAPRRTNIIHEPEFGKISIMTDLFRAFEEKALLVRLLEKCMDPNGVHIAIGSESEVQEMETCSLVTSTYSYKGVLGGNFWSRRMNFRRSSPC